MKKWYTYILIFAFCWCESNDLYAQSFLDVSEMLGDPISFSEREYGSGVSFYDINGDGWDDITVPAFNDSLICLINDQGTFTKIHPVYCDGQAKATLWGDYDNDGDADLFITFFNASNRLYKNLGDFQFEDVTEQLGLMMAPAESFSASWGDINSDGLLDLLVCNYNLGNAIGSWLFVNQGEIGFTEESNQRGLNIGSDYTLGASFFDFNEDGLQDIHLANDRAPADAILVNEGDYFVNNANSAGLDYYCNSMSSSVADFNHDGRFDIYVSNTPEGNFLWRRTTEPFYYNEAEGRGVGMERFAWGGSWIDFDNDSWEDLYINNHPGANDLQPFFINQTGFFTQESLVPNLSGSWSSFAGGKGDFNNDGYYDLAINCDENIPMKLLRNEGGDNNWVKVKLQGSISNRDGIGTLISYSFNDVATIRYTASNTGYLTQDSQWIILGIGDATEISELTLTWLSGQVDTYHNIPAHSVLTLVEGFEEVNLVGWNADEVIHLCEGESVTLEASASSPVTWNNGVEGNFCTVDQSGTYVASSTNELGIVNFSPAVHVQVESIAMPEVLVSHVSCTGLSDGTASLEMDDALQYDLFFEGMLVPEFSNLATGEYALVISTQNNCTTTQTFFVQEPSPLAATFSTSDITCFGLSDGLFQLENVVGGTGTYNTSLQKDGEEILPDAWQSLEEGVYHFTLTDENGCTSEESFTMSQPQPLILEVLGTQVENWFTVNASGGTIPYTITWNEIEIPNDYSVYLTEEDNYFVCTDQNNCITNLNVNIEPPVISAIQEIANDVLIFRWKDELVVKGLLPSQITVFDNLGRVLDVYKGSAIQTRMPLNTMATIALAVVNDQSFVFKIGGKGE